MENHSKCPSCGRNLTENELYCHFCEMDLPELEEKKAKQPDKKHK